MKIKIAVEVVLTVNARVKDESIAIHDIMENTTIWAEIEKNNKTKPFTLELLEISNYDFLE